MVGIVSLLLSSGVQKILICAPSNAGIDEIVRRLSRGIPTKDARRQVKLVRIAAADVELTPDIIPHTLQSLLKTKKELYASYTPAEVPGMKQKLKQYEGLLEEFVKGRREGLTLKCIELIAKFDKTHPELRSLSDKIAFLSSEVGKLQNLLRDLQTFNTAGKKVHEDSVLNDAEVVCTTLSTSGIDLLSERAFDCLIVDEACQVQCA